MDGSLPPRILLAKPVFEDWGYLARNMRPDEIEQYLAAHGESDYDPSLAALRFASTGGMVWTFVGRDGLPVAAGGFCPERPGVYNAWLAGTMNGWEADWSPMTRTFRKLCRNLIADDECHRIQVCALASRTAAHEWYERGLGFSRDGLLPAYCADGQDAIMFSLTKRVR